MRVKKIVIAILIAIGIALIIRPAIADELDDLLGGDNAPVSGSATQGTQSNTGTDSGDNSYMVDSNIVKYFNDDPAEDGGIPNPFESLLKPPAPPKPIPNIARSEEAPKPLRLKLIGVVINADMKIALIENLDKGENYELSEGEKTSDFSVVEISEDKVIIFSYRLNMRRTITLNE